MTRVEKHILRSLRKDSPSGRFCGKTRVPGPDYQTLSAPGPEIIASQEDILCLTDKGQALAKEMGLTPPGYPVPYLPGQRRRPGSSLPASGTSSKAWPRLGPGPVQNLTRAS